MSIAQQIRERIQGIKRGEPFNSQLFLKLGSRTNVDKTLSRFVEEGYIDRLYPGVFVRPKYNRFAGKVYPEISKVIQLIAKDNDEIIQPHGALAANQFKISTQVPMQLVYYTSGTTRELHIGNTIVKFIHTSNHKRLQYAGEKVGHVLALLWYLGKEQINTKIIEKIRKGISKKEFEALRKCSMPGWMRDAVEQCAREM